MSIAPERYFDDASLSQELRSIFARFCFIAHESDLPAVDHYFSFRLGQDSLTLRRAESGLSLLGNVCRHRFNLIDPPGYGQRPFRCGYHGWSYDGAGQVVFIPLRDQFSGDPQPLPTYRHETAAGFTFASSNPHTRAPKVLQMLDRVGLPAGPSFHRDSIRHRCNWKLMVENVLEGYHLSAVHSNTFGKSGYTTTSRAEALDGDDDTLLVTFPHDKFAAQLIAAVPGVEPSYRHLYIFPNLFVSVTNDLVYFVSNVLPVSAEESVLHYRLFSAPALTRLTSTLQEHIKEEAIKFTVSALNEDRAILESCQIGMHGAVGNYLLGDSEHRIAHFHDTYARWL